MNGAFGGLGLPSIPSRPVAFFASTGHILGLIERRYALLEPRSPPLAPESAQ
jgi:hypothetical protein